MACDHLLEAVARHATSRRAPGRAPLRSLRRDHRDLDLAGFLDASGLDLDDVYDGRRSWSDLREAAGAPTLPAGPHEQPLRRAIGRLLHVDDEERIATYGRLLASPRAPAAASLAERERRTLRMLVAAVTDQAVARSSTLQDGVDLLWLHPQVRSELLELLAMLEARVDHAHAPLESHPDAPLQVHAQYSRLEILAAMGVGSGAKIAAWQSGVFEAKAADAELLAFTLDKSSGGFSPTTRYRDYAISRTLIHWESQATTRADGATGLRYRHHDRDGRHILLFSRLRTDDRAFWFLGPGTYRSHVGELPMAITWQLHHPLPGDLYAAFAAAVA